MGTGTGGSVGLDMNDIIVSTGAAGGNITATAIADGGVTAFQLSTTGDFNAEAGGGTITVNTEMISLAPRAVAADRARLLTTGIINIQPINATTTIGVGDNGVGTLNINNQELTQLGRQAPGPAGPFPSLINIGQSTGAHTIDVNGGGAPPTLPSPYTFRGNGITVENFDIGANALGLDIGQAGAGIANIGNTITSGTITVSGMGASNTNTLKAQDIVNTWNVTGPDAGNINGMGVIDFSGVGNLVDGNNDDTFIFDDTIGVSGLVNGGAPSITNSLDYTNFTLPPTVQFLGADFGLASNIAGGFFNICCIIGNTITPPVPNIPVTFSTSIEVELAFNYLFLNEADDHFFALWQIFLLSQAVAYPNTLWSNISGAVLYQTLSSGLNRLEKWELEQEGIPPVVSSAIPAFCAVI